MGKLQKFEITFDQTKTVYSPGDSISGKVTVKIDQPLQCKAVKVNCNGFCGVTTKSNDTEWTVEEQYFNSTVSVADTGTLKAGEHNFPFKFLIAESAPTSFEGNYGRIIYRVRAFITTPRFAKDYNTEKAFYLLRPLNLNELPDVWEKSSSAVTQQFTYMLMKTGTVTLKAETDMKGYTPGDIIQVMANLHNQSGKTTGNIGAGLVQRITYETKKPVHDVRTIAEVEGGTVKAGKELEWKEQIIIPPLPQSSLVGCALIKIEYYVKVSLKSPDVLLTLPIHIGNISLDKTNRPSKKKAASASAAAEDASASAASPGPVPPTTKPTSAPRPAPRHNAAQSRRSYPDGPSAPQAEFYDGPEGGSSAGNGQPNKRQSQLVNAFSYAPGLSFLQDRQPNGSAPSAPSYGASNTSAPFAPEGASGGSLYPQVPPPSYDESCNT
ncbi:arrestin domain-containing protein 1a isoform X2 [Nelusetta ayraudi]|uniref:arrestin domain-containing protein 1a isoform X2 n=1 Tax=Nelusetta ayraudi TaxID=303726 RepID=UPI003F719EEB